MVPSASSNSWYHVNTLASCCTCPVGVTGAPCKHQSAVMQTFNVTEAVPVTTTSLLRRLFHGIASGGSTPEDWFETLAYEKAVVEEDGCCGCDDGDSAGPAPKTISDDPQSHLAEEAGASTSEEVEETAFLEKQLEDIVGLLKRKLREDTTFTAPVKSFVDTFGKLHTDSAVQSALFSFGKNDRGQSSVRARPRGFLQTSATIGVQPTAVSRRKAALGGRRTLGAGRPPKSSRKEHGYSRQGRPKGVPHNL
ncbi:uncharacterized protein LOC127361020 [Dicentrarchus labrax]|uniref:uncharacterized protein LOC127361020 n=1 Tax=Dicentrarchus labrax TaxID=13489 RepID=UPI0021F5AC1E|nr:uncharacterized protein LOC127361020 [Dicentrarchus labrax]